MPPETRNEPAPTGRPASRNTQFDTDRTPGLRRRDDLASYIGTRETVRAIRPNISGRTDQAVADLTEAYGTEGAVRWLVEALRLAGMPVAGRVIELSKVPGWSQAIADTRNLTRQAELCVAIERSVVDVTDLLLGGGS